MLKYNDKKLLDREINKLSGDESRFYWSGLQMWNWSRLTDKRYAGDNRLTVYESSYWLDHLAPRCRLIVSWSCRGFQGFGCSPIKTVHELGLERCEAVRSLSTIRWWVEVFVLSTRGLVVNDYWLFCCFYFEACRVATSTDLESAECYSKVGIFWIW